MGCFRGGISTLPIRVVDSDNQQVSCTKVNTYIDGAPSTRSCSLVSGISPNFRTFFAWAVGRDWSNTGALVTENTSWPNGGTPYWGWLTGRTFSAYPLHSVGCWEVTRDIPGRGIEARKRLNSSMGSPGVHHKDDVPVPVGGGWHRRRQCWTHRWWRWQLCRLSPHIVGVGFAGCPGWPSVSNPFSVEGRGTHVGTHSPFLLPGCLGVFHCHGCRYLRSHWCVRGLDSRWGWGWRNRDMMGDIAYRHTAQGLSLTRRMCCQCVARRSHRQRILCSVSTSAICAILLILGNVMHYIYLHIFSSLLAYRDLEMGPSTTLAVHSRAAMNGRLTALHKLVYCTISTDCSQLLEKTRPRWPIHFIYIEIVFFRMWCVTWTIGQNSTYSMSILVRLKNSTLPVCFFQKLPPHRSPNYQRSLS